MKAAHVLSSILLVIAGSACAQHLLAQSSFESDDLKAGKIHVKRIAVLPICARIDRLDWANRITSDEDASQQIPKDLWPVVTDALGQVGFSVDKETYSPEALTRNPELSAQVGRLQSKFGSVDAVGQHKQKEFQQLLPDPFREEVGGLHAPAEVEAIAVPQINCTVETKGHKWAPGSGLRTNGGCYVQIGLIDPRTGALIYIARFQGNDDWTRKPENVAPHILKSFEKFTRDSKGP
ncbi:hypothetical protein [Terracidiphilus gabretensis]|uniref:hypothetical protein n=1 Tax=Terracidiphilus gabretensis TaxID=1577687 RepID=UPI00071B5507|nr:hypothetical protein [Terracidiphilus gabretensis]